MLQSENVEDAVLRLRQASSDWDAEAATFDAEPDHGLRNPMVHAAWGNLVAGWLPPAPSTVLDIGCGTASLSLLCAGMGHIVMGIDVSSAMLAQARVKATAAEYPIPFCVMDAAHPALPPAQFDVLLCRHVLWALPNPTQVLQRWAALLKPGGRLILIEGYWFTDAGLHANEIVASLPPSVKHVTVQSLSDQPQLWGKPVTDERYAIIADI